MKFGKIIIFEGPDRSSKTTQISFLEKYFLNNGESFLKFHFGKPPKLNNEDMKYVSKHMFENTFKFVLENIKFNQNFIFDRFTIGEFIYAPLYRSYSGEYIFNIEKNCIEKYINEWKNVYLIIFIDTLENLINREDGDSFSTNIEMKQKEIDGFIEASKKSLITHKIIININNKSIEQVNLEVNNFLGI